MRSIATVIGSPPGDMSTVAGRRDLWVALFKELNSRSAVFYDSDLMSLATFLQALRDMRAKPAGASPAEFAAHMFAPIWNDLRNGDLESSLGVPLT